MSFYSSKASSSSSNFEYEAENIRRLQAQKSHRESQNTEKLKSILQTTYAMEEIGNNTNVVLKGQTQKLENIHHVTNETKVLVKKTNQTSKELSSFWYQLGKKIVRIFVNENNDGKTQKKSGQSETNEKEINNNGNRESFESCSESQQIYQNKEDLYLDEISNQIGKLKYVSKQTNKQLDIQVDLINKIDANIDFNSKKMEEANKRLKKNFL